MWEHYEDKYSRQLRSIIDTLLNEDYKKRPNPHDLVQLAQINQTKFPWFFTIFLYVLILNRIE